MSRMLAVAAGCTLLLGCAADPVKTIQTDAALRSRVMGAIVADSALASGMADTLIRDPGTRALVVEKLASDGESMQLLMARIARDPTAVDGIIGFAVQESTMKEHVLTLLKGMQIAEGRR
jgi:hypothetical protein